MKKLSSCYAFMRFQESWYSYKGFLVILDGAVHLGLYMFCNREQSNKHLLKTHVPYCSTKITVQFRCVQPADPGSKVMIK